METLVFYFKQFLRNHPELNLEYDVDIEEIVNDYMWENHIYGEDVFNRLCEEAKKF